MATLGRLQVDLVANAQRFREGLGDAQKSFQSVGQSMTNVGRTLTASVTLPIVGVGAAAFKMAADSAEAASKMQAVFGGATQDMNAWIAELRDTIPETTAGLQGMTSEIGDLLIPLGIAPDKAQDMTRSVVELAGDLASFNNIPMAEALERIRSGLVGQNEPLLKFGVAINAADVEARALALGLIEEGEALDAAARAQASFSLILEKTTAAHGDAAKTAGSAANQIKFFWAETKELADIIGQQLLPVVTPMISSVKDFIKRLQEVNPATLELGVKIAALAAAIGPLAVIGGTLTRNVGMMAGAFAKLTTVLIADTSATTANTTAKVGSRAALLALANPVTGLAALLAGGLVAAFIASRAQARAFADELAMVKTEAEQAASKMGQFSEAALAVKIDRLNRELGDQQVKIGELNRQLETASNRSLPALRREQAREKAALEAITLELEAARSAYQDTGDAVDETATAMDASTATINTQTEAVVGLTDRLAAFRIEAHREIQTLREGTVAGQRRAAAIAKGREEYMTLGSVMGGLRVPTAQLQVAQSELHGTMRGGTTATSGLGGAVAELDLKLGGLGETMGVVAGSGGILDEFGLHVGTGIQGIVTDVTGKWDGLRGVLEAGDFDMSAFSSLKDSILGILGDLLGKAGGIVGKLFGLFKGGGGVSVPGLGGGAVSGATAGATGALSAVAPAAAAVGAGYLAVKGIEAFMGIGRHEYFTPEELAQIRESNAAISGRRFEAETFDVGFGPTGPDVAEPLGADGDGEPLDLGLAPAFQATNEAVSRIIDGQAETETRLDDVSAHTADAVSVLEQIAAHTERFGSMEELLREVGAASAVAARAAAVAAENSARGPLVSVDAIDRGLGQTHRHGNRVSGGEVSA